MLTKEKKIIDAVVDKLPIKALAERVLLPKLKDAYPDIAVNLDTVLQIHSMVDLGDVGGIGCEICPLNYDRTKAKSVVVCSLTHLRIKVGEPNFDLLTDYKTKRIKKLAQQNAMPWRNMPPRR